uniref:Uncharacterized protein n=1 Tax=Glossina palpalis gambiensis TaxID=67801 RepID=A0A1B0AT18_9MUSC
MKLIVFSVCLLIGIAAVLGSSDNGHFIPKAFYTLDEHGHKTELHSIDPHNTDKELRDNGRGDHIWKHMESIADELYKNFDN